MWACTLDSFLDEAKKRNNSFRKPKSIVVSNRDVMNGYPLQSLRPVASSVMTRDDHRLNSSLHQRPGQVVRPDGTTRCRRLKMLVNNEDFHDYKERNSYRCAVPVGWIFGSRIKRSGGYIVFSP